ncbi:MAG: B12-binding domain-containing radical SAM protein [Chloroflexi bacterium]|nr:B12-binding domain-containing radical SAM protein [Chloroflexota bacterium]
MADIVLVFPKTGFDIKKVTIDLPLSLLSAASLVARDYEVKIIDQRINSHWEEELERELMAEPLCVGISSLTGPQIEFGLKVAKIVKEAKTKTKVVWGGVHATLLPEQTVQHSLVDIVVVGEGELTFRNLVIALDKKKSLVDVKGIAFEEDGKIIKTEPESPLDLNELPELPYDLVDVNEYIGSQGRFPSEETRSLIFISSRGCAWACTFCCNPRLCKRHWRSMNAERTYERVMSLVERYNLDAVTFHDEEFLVGKTRAERIAQLIGGKFKWWIQGRMQLIKDIDLVQLEKGGLCAVQPGVESGSDRILKLIKKGETVSEMLEANRHLAETDIRPLYNFMMGFPTETYEELMESVDLALKLLEENHKAQISGFYVLVPYPGTEIFDLAVKQGFDAPDSLEQWSLFNRQHMRTPWIQDRLPIFQSIMVSSKLIDETRLRTRLKAAFQGLPVPLFFCKYLGRFYQRRWRRHIFKSRFDTFVNRILLSLFSLSQNAFVSWWAGKWSK